MKRCFAGSGRQELPDVLRLAAAFSSVWMCFDAAASDMRWGAVD